MTADDELLQEHVVRGQLRKLVIVVGVLAVITLLVSFSHVGLRDSGSRPLWTWFERGWFAASLVPLVWVFRVPSRKPVLLAAAWYAMTSLVLKLFEDKKGDLEYFEINAAIPSAFLVVGIAGLVIVVMPVLRWRHREETDLVPTARVVDDD